MPAREALRQHYEAIRARFAQKHARLQVHYLLVLNVNPKEIARAVAAQPVRTEMLRTFNGAEEAGSYAVDTFPDLRRAMVDVIARISETDARRSAAVTSPSEGGIALTLPFSVSRIIALSVGPGKAGDFAAPGGIEGSPADRIEVEGRMAQEDTLPNWRDNGILAFRATQLTPRTPLAPGRHVIAFDRRPGDELTLLFRTDVAVGWSLKERENGPELARSGQKAAGKVPAGRRLALDVTVFDRIAGKPVESFRDVPADAVFEARISRRGEGREDDAPMPPVRLSLDRERGRIGGSVTFPEKGRFRLDVEMRIAGIPSKSSGALEVEAEARSPTTFAMAVDPGTGDGRRFTVETAAGPPRGDPRLATITVTPRGPPQGTLRARVLDLPAGIEALHDGAPLPADGKPIRFRTGVPIPIELRRTGAWTGLAGGRPVAQAARVEIEEEEGGASLSGTVTILARIAAARLTHLGHDDRPGGAMPLPIADLGGGRRHLDFRLDGAAVAPGEADFVIALPGGLDGLVEVRPLASAGAAFEPATIRVFLRAGAWCRCRLGFRQGRHVLSLSYRPAGGAQSADAEAEIALDDAGGEAARICAGLALSLLLLIWLAGATISYFCAHRIRPHAIMSIERAGSYPDKRRLARRGAWVGMALRALGWPASLVAWRWRPWRMREERVAEGLRLIAYEGGVDGLPAGRAWPPLELERSGAELAKESPVEPGRRPVPVALPWGSVLRNRQQRTVIGLWGSRQEFQPRRPGTL